MAKFGIKTSKSRSLAFIQIFNFKLILTFMVYVYPLRGKPFFDPKQNVFNYLQTFTNDWR